MTIKEFNMRYIRSLMHPELFLIPYGKKKPEVKYRITIYTRTGSAELLADGSFAYSTYSWSNLTTHVVVTTEDEQRVWHSTRTSSSHLFDLPIGKYKAKIIGGYNANYGFYLDNSWYHFSVVEENNEIKIKTEDYGDAFVVQRNIQILWYTPVLVEKKRVYTVEDSPEAFSCNVTGSARPRLGKYNSNIDHFDVCELVSISKKTTAIAHGSIKVDYDLYLLDYSGVRKLIHDTLNFFGDPLSNITGAIGRFGTAGQLLSYPGSNNSMVFFEKEPISVDTDYEIHGLISSTGDPYPNVFGTMEENNKNGTYTVHGKVNFSHSARPVLVDSRFTLNTYIISDNQSSENAYLLGEMTESDLNSSSKGIMSFFENSFDGYTGEKINIIYPQSDFDFDTGLDSASSVAQIDGVGFHDNGCSYDDEWFNEFLKLNLTKYYNKFYTTTYRSTPYMVEPITVITCYLDCVKQNPDKYVYSNSWSRLYTGLIKLTINMSATQTGDYWLDPPVGTLLFDATTDSITNVLKTYGLTLKDGENINQSIDNIPTNCDGLNGVEKMRITKKELLFINPVDAGAEFAINNVARLEQIFLKDIIPSQVQQASAWRATKIFVNEQNKVTYSNKGFHEFEDQNNFTSYLGCHIPRSHITSDCNYWLSLPTE